MRESIGATWVFSIVIVFIMMFTAYLAISVNYARAFKIKNAIITMIENNEGVNEHDMTMLSNLDDYLYSNAYDAYGVCEDITDQGEEDWQYIEANIYPNADGTKNGVCIYKKPAQSSNTNGFCDKSYYRVITFFKVDFPILHNIFTFSVKGNSAPIYDLADEANRNCVH